MKKYLLALGMAGVAWGCGSSSHQAGDAALADAPVDVAVDAPVDAAIDAAPDATIPPDAMPVTTSPTCADGATRLLDVSPRKIASIARSQGHLYVGAYAQDSSGTITNASLITIDLATGLTVGTPMALASAPYLSVVGDDVYMTISGGSTIQRLHAGAAPVTVVTGRLHPGAVTADATHVYWAENQAGGGDDIVRRQLLTGGTVETVLTCGTPFDLLVVGSELYCPSFQGSIVHRPSDGSGMLAGIANPNTSYPITSTIADGNALYYVALHPNPEVYQVPLPGGPAMRLYQTTEFGRASGIAATPDFLYLTDTSRGLYRMNRATHQVAQLSADGAYGDPVVWNGQLYYATANPNLSPPNYVMHCAN